MSKLFSNNLCALCSLWLALSGDLAQRRGGPFEHALENEQPVGATQEWVASSLGMRHQAADVAFLVADSRDIVLRAVRVGRLGCAPARIAVAEQHATFTFEMVENGIFSKIAALTVGDGKTQDSSVPGGIRERTVMSLDTDMNVFANEVKPSIANERAWQKPRLAQDLEAIANADDQSRRRQQSFSPRACIGEKRAIAPQRR